MHSIPSKSINSQCSTELHQYHCNNDYSNTFCYCTVIPTAYAFKQQHARLAREQKQQQFFDYRQRSLHSFVVVLLFVFLLNIQDSHAVVESNAKLKSTTTTRSFESKQKQINSNTKPNIVIILIDDMGFNDVSFHGSNQILTPNIDALAYNGIILNRHYVPNLCTPSRATLLTGKYPIHTGTQHFVIVNDEPWGLPLSERLMPEIFRDAGYSTNLIGKWHLGFWKKDLTPTMRGFDYHYGYYSGYIDYYDHTMRMLNRNYSFGLDMRRNMQPWPKANGSYATDEFTQEAIRVITSHDVRQPLLVLLSHLAVHTGNEDDPMQAPEEEVNKFGHITDRKRRIYAGMVSRLDNSVGKTIRALADKGILNNTIVLLYSDNGAPTLGIHSNAGSNYPFRGQKESPWEGGLRSAGLIWSPLLEKQSYVSEQLIHASDWLPTLASAADIPLPKELKLDGMDQWASLSQQLPPQSRSLLHVLDDKFGYASYMRGSLKYVNGSTFGGQYDGWLGERAATLQEEDPFASYYVQTVLSSEVQTIIGQRRLLNIERIEKLRAQATHRCLDRVNSSSVEVYRCSPLEAPCLFNIDEDPCERFNLAKLQPSMLAELQRDVELLRQTAVPPARVARSDPLSDPALHNGTWEWWDYLEKNQATQQSVIGSIWLGLSSGLLWLQCWGFGGSSLYNRTGNLNDE